VKFDQHARPIEHAAIRRAVADVQLAVLPGADHLLLFARSESVNRLLIDFLDGDGTR